MVRSNKYVGVYFNILQSNDKVFYFTYQEPVTKKKRWVKVGKYSEGMRESTAYTLRSEQISKMRHGEDIKIIANKKKVIITYDELAQAYFDDKDTKKDRIAKYNRYIKPKFGDMNIDDITKLKVREFMKYLTTLGKSNQTVNSIRELLSAIINHNIRERELVYRNPCIGIQKLKVDNNRERYLNLYEIEMLYERIEESKESFLLRLFVNLALQTGGRLETILNIRKKDINLDSCSVTLKNLKTNNTYVGFLQDSFIEEYKRYILGLKVNDFVVTFDGDKSEKLSARSIQTRLKPILDELFNEGLEIRDSKNRVVVHTLRHTFASHLAINSVPIFTIQRLMDHRRIDQTMRYAKLNPENGKNAVLGLYK